jgi:hypothetical protein
MVKILVQLPENVAGRFGNTPEAAGRQLLESAAAAGYRSGRLSRSEVREMLGFSWHETEQFLAAHDCPRHYSISDLDDDRRTLSELPLR